MAFVKEESEEMKIEEAFRVKQEDTEKQIGWFHSQNLNLVKLSTEMNDVLEESQEFPI